MKAVRIHRFGGPEVLQVDDIPNPDGGDGKLLFARIAGAEVIATAPADEMDRLRALGAVRAIDHRAQKFEEIVRDVNLVFDLIGKDTQYRSFQTLKRGGRLISTVQEPDLAKAEEAGIPAKRFMAEPNAEQLANFAELIDTGQVVVTVAQVFDLDQAVEANRSLEDEHPHGKVVLKVG
jgi:NADPH:quinone reductase-like Zn-dependent oxidoreductase